MELLTSKQTLTTKKHHREDQISTTGTKSIPANKREEPDPLVASTNALRGCMATQDGGLKLLFEKAEVFSSKLSLTRSPDLSFASEDLLEVIEGLKGSRDGIIKAFNTLNCHMPVYDSKRKAGVAVKPSTTHTGTNTEPFIRDGSKTPVTAEEQRLCSYVTLSPGSRPSWNSRDYKWTLY